MLGLAPWAQSPPAQPATGNVTRTDANGVCSLRCRRCKVGVDWPAGSYSDADLKWFSIIHADEGSAHTKKKGARR
jgi:hypothetical protein